jgi:Fe-S cluster assembly ATP-binding protein
MNKLVINNLAVEVGGKMILRGVSLRVGMGETHVLMGPNGSGKSTLAWVLMGHPGYRAVTGSVIWEIGGGKVDLLKKTTDVRARMGMFMSFQNPVTVPGVSVFELMRANRQARVGRSVVEFYREVKERAEAIGLDESFLKRSINDGFSGGEKKKVELLQMMVISPKLAILDEIDTGLDVDALKMVALGVGDQAKRGTGILFITHNTRILKYLKPDYVHILKGGRIVKSGGSEVVKEVEEHGYEKIG